MAKGGIFTCLNLDRDHILPDIQEFCSKKFSDVTISELKEINKGNSQYRYSILETKPKS